MLQFLGKAMQSEMTNFCWFIPPCIVATIEISYRGFGQLTRLCIVEASDTDRDVISAILLDISLSEHRDTAAQTEEVVLRLSVELIVAHMMLAAVGLICAPQKRALVQNEQLHLPVPRSRSRSVSNWTAPQWQLPL
jgi:hypothetical protein